jgi:hypothetical protein
MTHRRPAPRPPSPIPYVEALFDAAPLAERSRLPFSATMGDGRRCVDCGRTNAVCACPGAGSKASGRWVRRGRDIIVT